MGLQQCGLKVNNSQKELQPHGSIAFPCAGYSKLYTDQPEDLIPWHWHEELEAVYLQSGRLKLRIPAGAYELNTGDCMILNSSILHSAAADRQCELHSLVFSPLLVTGRKDSVFSQKYISPLISCPSFTGYVFKAGGKEQVTGRFVSAFEALANDNAGMEFFVREQLSGICFYLYQQFEREISAGSAAMNQDNLRLKKMLDYIHQNFAGNLSLSDIAKEAAIGERECLRCFKRTIQTSPMQYLLKYRLMQGASLLLENPDNSVSEIASCCGFDSPSSFSKLFKRLYHCPPREYRGRQS